MNYYRVNLNKSYDAFQKHLKVTCPLEGHVGWVKMIQVKAGDIVLISKGLSIIESICVATKDAYVGNISYFCDAPELCSNSLITLDLNMLQECTIKSALLNALLTKDSLLSNNFCVQLHPLITNEFNNLLNCFLADKLHSDKIEIALRQLSMKQTELLSEINEIMH